MIALTAGASVALMGGAILAGWLLHNEALKTIIPWSQEPIKPNLATGMLLCGAALSLLSRKKLTNPIRICAAAMATVVITLSALTVGEYFFDWDLGIEHWLIGDVPAVLGISHPGRMSPLTAMSFVLVGIALFTASQLMQKRLRLPLVGGLGGALLVGGAVPLIGCFFEMLFGPRWNYMGTTPGGLAGAVAFMLLGSGLLALLRGHGSLEWSLDGLTTTGFASGLVIMALAAGLTYSFTVKMQQTAMQVGHAQEIRRQLEEIEGNLSDLALDERSYVITANERLLEEWGAKEFEVRDHFVKLQKLQADNSRRQPLLRQFSALISKQINWAKQTIEARRERGFPAAQEMVATGTGVEFLEQSRGLIQAIESDENAKLLESQTQSELASRTAFSMLPLGVFLCFAILSLVSFFLNAGMGERKQAEHSLRQSEERMRAILDSALDCIITMDHHGRVAEFNPAAEKTFGYSREEAIGQSLSELIISPSLRERHQKGLAHYLTTGDAPVLGKRLELSAMKRDGSEFPIELAITRIGMQKPPMFTGFIRDITDRKLSDEAIRASEQRFSSFMDNVPGFAWMKDAEGRYVYGNRLLQELLLPGPEWRGRTVEEVWPPEIAAPLRANDENVIQTKAPLQIIEMIEQSGEKRAVLSSKFPILDGKGEVAFVCGIGIDITERKQTEERLREQADIINRAHDAIIIRNFEDRRIVFWNSGAERLYGWTAAEVMGGAGEAIFSDPKEIEKIMSGLLSTDEFRGEVKQTTKDGKVLTTEGRATLVRNPDGTPRSILIICTDITEQKNLETRLLRAQRLESIGTLASGVAHDLNNILTPILICAEVLRTTTDPADIKSAISLVEENARRGAEIVKQVLTFARGTEGERVFINPSHLIEEIIDIARKTFPKSIEIKSSYPEDIWSIEGDPTQLHQVCLNLAVNSRDAMPDGGSLVFAAENFDVDEHFASINPGAKVGPYVQLRASDTGAGMPAGVIDKIFDPFFTTKEVGKGTGLGLSSALGIIKSHGGFVAVSSEIGIGTTFKVFLPAQIGEASSRKTAAPLGPLNGKGELILVVDDEAGIRRVSKIILETHNYRVLQANDGREALGVFAQQMGSINAVLTDITMPNLDGVALIRAIKQMKPEMAFIASTGQDDVNRFSELQALGVSNFLGKPYDTQTLLTKVHDSLSAQTQS